MLENDSSNPKWGLLHHNSIYSQRYNLRTTGEGGLTQETQICLRRASSAGAPRRAIVPWTSVVELGGAVA